MKSVVERKCDKCKGVVTIDRRNAQDVIYFKKLYYHKQCFIEMAERKSKQKRGSPQQWVDALNNIQEIEDDTKQMLNNQLFMVRDTDELNDYLMKNYNVTTIDSRFWQIVRDLGNGIYRQRKCKKVDLDTLYGAWVWGQNNLDKIDRNNKQNNKGPKTDDERLFYDIAIIVKKIPQYLAYKEKSESAKREMAQVTVDDVDIARIGQRKYETKRDISDIADYLFVE